jgi:hypothetical protein
MLLSLAGLLLAVTVGLVMLWYAWNVAGCWYHDVDVGDAGNEDLFLKVRGLPLRNCSTPSV